MKKDEIKETGFSTMERPRDQMDGIALQILIQTEIKKTLSAVGALIIG